MGLLSTHIFKLDDIAIRQKNILAWRNSILDGKKIAGARLGHYLIKASNGQKMTFLNEFFDDGVTPETTAWSTYNSFGTE